MKASKRTNRLNEIKLTFIERSLVIFFFTVMTFRPFIAYNFSALSSSERQDLFRHPEECFRLILPTKLGFALY